jgi:hypothetical protein
VETAGTRARWGLSTRAWVLLGTGLLLREAFSFWTGHPYDFEVWIRTGYEVAHGVNPYNGIWPAVPGVSISYYGQLLPSAAYLPFWPELLGGLYRLWEVVGGGNRFVLYFLLKQPGILADIATGYLLSRLVQRWTADRRAAEALLSFWVFFPYAIVISAIWGQFDPIVVMVLLALLFVRSPLERNIVNGIGIFVKWVTVIFLPLEILRERGIRRLGVLVALAVPLAATVVIFAASGWSFTHLGALTSSQSHGGGLGMNFAYLLSLGDFVNTLSHVPYFYAVVPYAWVPGVAAAGLVGAKWVRTNAPRAELRAMLLIVTVFLLLRWGLYEQYMVYLFSLAALDIAAFHPGRRALLYLTVVLSGAFLLVNNDLGIRFLTPVDPGIWNYAMGIDASATWGFDRAMALTVLSVLIGLTLIQWVRTLVRDDPHPEPWLLAWRSLLSRAASPGSDA